MDNKWRKSSIIRWHTPSTFVSNKLVQNFMISATIMTILVNCERSTSKWHNYELRITATFSTSFRDITLLRAQLAPLTELSMHPFSHSLSLSCSLFLLLCFFYNWCALAPHDASVISKASFAAIKLVNRRNNPTAAGGA